MKDLLDKLSSYNIFNYLLPGTIFAVIAEKITSLSLIQKDVFIGVFWYYFIGLIISRVGSLVIEPVLKKVKFVTFTPYADFVSVSEKVDNKLKLLVEVNNMYRTFCSLFLLLIVLKCSDFMLKRYSSISEWYSYVTIIGLLMLFLFSYRKQSKYVVKRINAHKNKE